MRLSHHRSAVGGSHGRRGERGAVVLIVALSLSVLVTATAFTVDLGHLSTRRRSAQAQADVLALDLSRRLDGRTAAQIAGDPAWQDAIDAIVARNAIGTGPGHELTVSLGTWDARTERFVASAPSAVPTAVRVQVGEEVDFAFVPGNRTTRRMAVGSNSGLAGHSIGSFAARLDTGDSALLTALLGDAIGVTLVGWEGLATGQVSLGLLATELGIDLGTPDEVLNTDLTVADVLLAEALVLERGGDFVRAALLRQVVADLPYPDLPLQLGDLVSILPGGEGLAATTLVDALELVTAVAMIANGDHFLDLGALDLTLGIGDTAVNLTAQVIERPRWAFGPTGTTAETAQVRITATGQVAVPNVSSTTFSLELTAASGRATSTRIVCGTPQQLALDVDTGLVSVRTSLTSRLTVLGAPVADVRSSAAISDDPNPSSATFVLPPDAYGVARQAPETGLDLGGLGVTVDRVDVIGIPLGVVIAPLVNTLTSTVLNPLLAELQAQILAPVLDLLGVSVAGADVAPLGVACAGSRLVG